MTGYGYVAQGAADSSRRFLTPSDPAGDHWVLTKFSRVLALALGKKLWAKPVQPQVHFGEVIERVKQAQAECDEKRVASRGQLDEAD